MKRFSTLYKILVATKTFLFLLCWSGVFSQAYMEIAVWTGIIFTGILILYYIFLFGKISTAEKYQGFFMLLLSLAADVFFYFVFTITTGIKHLFDFSSFG